VLSDAFWLATNLTFNIQELGFISLGTLAHIKWQTTIKEENLSIIVKLPLLYLSFSVTFYLTCGCLMQKIRQ
jgi:hypothetical protein